MLDDSFGQAARLAILRCLAALSAAMQGYGYCEYGELRKPTRSCLIHARGVWRSACLTPRLHASAKRWILTKVEPPTMQHNAQKRNLQVSWRSQTGELQSLAVQCAASASQRLRKSRESHQSLSEPCSKQQAVHCLEPGHDSGAMAMYMHGSQWSYSRLATA